MSIRLEQADSALSARQPCRLVVAAHVSPHLATDSSLFRAPRFCVNTQVVSFCGGQYVFGSWSAKLEYFHVGFGLQLFSRTLIANGFFFARGITLTDDVVRAGVNDNFGWGGPVAARC